MRALVKLKNGYDNMDVITVDKPKVHDDLVLIKPSYVGICGTDIHTFKGEYANTKTPVTLGHEFSGVVVEVGPKVKNIKIGDKVTSETTFETCGECEYCLERDYNLCSNRKGIGTQAEGAFADYVLSREESVHILPENVSLKSASLTEPLACSVHAVMEKTCLKHGETVLVIGPGPIGNLTAQVALSQGAIVIMTGLDGDKDRLKLAKELGVHHVINVQKEDLKSRILDITDNRGVDKVFDCSGSPHAVNDALKLVNKKGSFVQVGIFTDDHTLLDTNSIIQREIEYIGSRSQKPSSWHKSLKLLDEGKVNTEILISNIYELDDWRSAFEQVIRGDGMKVVIKP